MNRNDKLKSLINDASRLGEFAWLRNLRIDASEFDVAEEEKSIPIGAMKEIYWTRAQINRERDSPIKGYDLLLKNLNNTSSEKVAVHEMTDQDGCFYRILTNPDISELFGILKFLNSEIST